MRLPNGYGSVIKLNGNRRRPYIARKTVGYDKNGRQIYHIIGYFVTKDDAITALSNYNQQDIPEPFYSIYHAKIIPQGGHFDCNGDYADITLPVTYKNQCFFAEAVDVLWAETTSFKISYTFIWNFGLKNTNSKIRFLNTNKDINAGAVKYFSLGV